MRELLRQIAAKEHVMIIRRYEAMQFIAAAQDAGGFGQDEFERTEAGYNCLAQYLASAITLGAFGKGMSNRPLRSQQQPQPHHRNRRNSSRCNRRQRYPKFNSLKKSLPLSSTTMKAGKFSTSIRQIASIPSSGYSSVSTFLMQCSARFAAAPPIEAR